MLEQVQVARFRTAAASNICYVTYMMTPFPEIKVEPLQSPSFRELQARHKSLVPAWENDEPVASLHRRVARFNIDPETLAWVEQDVRAMEGQVSDSSALVRPGYLDLTCVDKETDTGVPVPDRLLKFLYISAARFDRLIRSDTGVANLPLSFGVYFGPYVGDPESYMWHRDFAEEPGGFTYILPLLGKLPTFAKGESRNSDFVDTHLLPGREPSVAIQYATRVVTAHDSIFTPHHGPGPENNGHARMLLNCFVHDAFLQGARVADPIKNYGA